MMMYGDKYDYFWVDQGGFDYTDFCINSVGEFQSQSGANSVKHLVGNNNDHVIGIGTSMQNMKTSLSTHLLRLADVYLIYAEAVIGNNGSTTNAKALECYNAIRSRAGYTTLKTSITWEDVWKERRLELACEGDRWYDYVRWHYYQPTAAIAELKAQKRSYYAGLDDYYKSGVLNTTTTHYDDNPAIPNITNAHFMLPFPDTDLTMNPNLLQDPVKFDFGTISY